MQKGCCLACLVLQLGSPALHGVPFLPLPPADGQGHSKTERGCQECGGQEPWAATGGVHLASSLPGVGPEHAPQTLNPRVNACPLPRCLRRLSMVAKDASGAEAGKAELPLVVAGELVVGEATVRVRGGNAAGVTAKLTYPEPMGKPIALTSGATLEACTS